MLHLIQFCTSFSNPDHQRMLTFSSSWLHHANVDRITALYQAMHPNDYLTPSHEIYGSYTIVPGGDVTLSTPLAPFSKNQQGDFYTSSSSQALSTFGYTYPEIQDWNLNTVQLQNVVTGRVNSLYGPSSRKSRRDASATERQVTEWSAAISVEKYSCDGHRFIIRLFLEAVPEDPKDWGTSCIGSFAVLPSPNRIVDPSPPAMPAMAYNELSLDDGLNARGYDGQDTAVTTEYLKQNLHWSVQLVSSPQMMLHL